MCERTPDISEACQFVNSTRKSTKLRFIIRHRTIEISIPYFIFIFSYFEVEITLKKHINFTSSGIHFVLKTQEADLVFSVQNVTIPLVIKE
jgi:hypothetical protein